ncbi:IS66 family transposase [Vibrio coralliilyticus]|uniref:IS66 family transposase n=2 Tax=Vibrionaceae TaxID=641 RepID=UPI0009B647CF
MVQNRQSIMRMPTILCYATTKWAVLGSMLGYQGYLHVDGYKGYHDTAATRVGCWAHACRKFIEAQKEQGNDEDGGHIALTHINTFAMPVPTFSMKSGR